ncbi:hypothetical protein [Kitasatospora cystarginea]|nr:hypothetical protein [Kitasatospora cystarginea]
MVRSSGGCWYCTHGEQRAVDAGTGLAREWGEDRFPELRRLTGCFGINHWSRQGARTIASRRGELRSRSRGEGGHRT